MVALSGFCRTATVIMQHTAAEKRLGNNDEPPFILYILYVLQKSKYRSRRELISTQNT